MKRKITLVSVMLLIAAFTFGQKPAETHHRKFSDFTVKKQVNIADSPQEKMEHKGIRTHKSTPPVSSQTSSRVVKQKLDSLIYYEWDFNTSMWVGSGREEFSYNYNGNLTEQVDLYWNGSSWQYYDKTEYTYNANGLLSKEIDSQWSGSQWEESNKYEYTYDASGKISEEKYFYWDGIQWIEDGKIEYTYDLNGNLIEEMQRYWDGTQWMSSQKREYTWDASGNVTEEINYYWSAMQWSPSYKYEYAYNGNGKKIQEIESYWVMTQWELGYKSEFGYNANGKLTQEIFSFWDGMSWELSEKLERTIDANGNVPTEVFYIWDGTQWEEDYKQDLTYNNTYSFNDLVLPFTILEEAEDYFNHMATQFVESEIDSTTGNWIASFKGTLHYSSVNVNSVFDVETAEISVYPNPVSDQLQIRISNWNGVASFQLLDVQGRLLLSKNVTNQDQIDLSQFSNGLYVYKLIFDGHTSTGKLIKE